MDASLTWVDAVLAIALVAAAAAGARRGASGVAGALLGAALGLTACAWALPHVPGLVADPVWSPVATVVAGLLLLVLGEGLGLRVGSALRRGLGRQKEDPQAPADWSDVRAEDLGEAEGVVEPEGVGSASPPAPCPAPPSDMPSMTAETRSSSAGYSCSARSYLREIGRK